MPDRNRTQLTITAGAVGPVEITLRYLDDAWANAGPQEREAMAHHVTALSEQLAAAAFAYWDRVDAMRALEALKRGAGNAST